MSHPRPLVSIVTPSYNQARFLEDLLHSIQAQTYPRLEHLVIDGGSTDGTADVLRRAGGRVSYWVSEPDEGQAHAVQKGFERAKGAIVAWINADDVYFSPSALSDVVDAFHRHPHAGAIYGDAALINAQGAVVRVLPALSGLSLNRLAAYCPVQPSIFVRGELAARFPVRRGLRYGLDYECWLRMCRGGVRFHYLPKLLTGFRIHGASKTAMDQRGILKELSAIKAEYFGRSWRVRWPAEPMVRRSQAVWLRMRGFTRFPEVYRTSLAFRGTRPEPLRFCLQQLTSRTLQEA